MTRKAWLLGLALAAACGTPAATVDSTVPVAPPTTGAATTDPAPPSPRQLWEAAAIADYHYSFLDDCGECNQLPPRQVLVWGSEVVDPERSAPSVEDVFDLIDKAQAGGSTVEVVYHPQLGFPTDVWIDRGDRAFDGGTHWVLTDLAIGLPGEAAGLPGLEAARTLWRDAGPERYEYRWSVMCRCPLDGTIWTRVEDGQVSDWQVDSGELDPISITPITVDTMLDDLAEMLASQEGIDVEGVRITGWAQYHPDLGYPEWVGFDVEVLDPTSELAVLAPRIVFAVTQFTELEEVLAPPGDLEAARARWEAQGLRTYSYELTVHDVVEATFSDPYLVRVSEGMVASVTMEDVEVEYFDLPVFTIDDLFDRIEEWMAAGINVLVLYHQETGHPVVVMLGGGDQVLSFSIDRLGPG